MSDILLGIDVGTSFVKASLIEADGAILAEAERPVQTSMPSAGIAEQDAAAIVADIVSMLGEIAARQPSASARVAAIGTSAQTAGAIAVDRDGTAITPWFPSALDTRAHSQLVRMKERAGEQLFGRNGAWPFTTPRMLWWRETMPEVFGKMACVPSLAGFVVASLAEDPRSAMAIDATTLTWYGAADLVHRQWDRDLVEALELPFELLPRIAPSCSTVGRLSGDIAARTGLRAGIPLAVGIGDTVASLVGANVLSPGEVYSVNGSFTNYLVCVDRCLIDLDGEFFQPLASPVDDVWYAIVYLAGGGFVHRGMASLLGGDQDQPDFAALDRAAAAVAPGASGLTFMPYFSGRFCPPESNASGGFHGLGLTHGRAELWRAVLEGLTFDLLDLTNAVAKRIEGWQPRILRLAGGGSKSMLWCQIQADMLGVPAERFGAAPSAPTGAALTAGVAIGLWPDLKTAAGRLHLPREQFEPDSEKTADYARLAERRRGLIESLRPSWSYLAAD